MRIEDTPELFGVGCGSGTIGEVKCEFCDKVYNQGETGDNPSPDNDSIELTWFAGKQVCYCCFERIENEILKRMKDILPWYKRIIEAKRKLLDQENENMIAALKTEEGQALRTTNASRSLSPI